MECVLPVLLFLFLAAWVIKDPKPRMLWSSTHPSGELHPPKYSGDAGYDLSISEPATLLPHTLIRVPCGIRVALPDGVSSLVIPRSSSVKEEILVFSTLIDSGYRGPLFVFCYNLSNSAIHLETGMRIAQLLPIRNIPMNTRQVDEGLALHVLGFDHPILIRVQDLRASSVLLGVSAPPGVVVRRFDAE